MRFSAFSRFGTAGWMLGLAGSLLLTLSSTTAARAMQAGNAPATGPAAQAATPAGGKKSSPASGNASTGSTTTRRHPVHRRTRHHPQPKPAVPVVVAPVAPPPPVPPAQQAAHPATISFRGGNLRIDANNSSLEEVLTGISRKTGLVIEGMNHDQRVYGQYGPGPVASTLMKLLDGAGYDYVIIGGGAGQSPTKLLLTPGANAPPGGSPASAANSAPVASSGGAYTPADPTEPAQPKSPQQIFDELRALHHPGRPQ